MPELKQLFNHGTRKRKGTSAIGPSKRKTIEFKTWRHTFVCLSDPEDNEAPEANERAKLLLAGLGEKKISLLIHSSADDIKSQLFDEYPKLKAGGGFELLRMRGHGRDLEVIPIPYRGYTVEYLKAVVLNAKIFICPMQTNLDLPSDACTSSVS